MAPRETCSHERARFHSVQRLGRLPPVELWHCPDCHSTVSAETVEQARRDAAA
ncbi:MAG: hypothetical protein ACOC8E_06375 [Planctomycetota bacterium]